MSTNSTVFIGAFLLIGTNWSQGRVYGATLTLHTTNAAILIAALAMFVGFTSAKSWSILCFALHQIGVTRRPRDGVYHQLQATLRNSGTEFETTWEVMKIAWAWSIRLSPRLKSSRKAIGLLLLGLLHAFLFAAAGLFASRLTTFGNEVLVRSDNCGQWSFDIIDNSSDPTRALYDYATHLTNNAELSAQYFEDCLSDTQSTTEVRSSTQCNVFKTLQLPYTTTRNDSCPFAEDMCLGPINSSVTFDTGLLDSSTHLGINAAKKYRVQLRKTMTCSPITTKGFVQNGNVTLNDGHFINITAALYGPQGSPNALPDVVSELVANSTVIIEKQDADFLSNNAQYYTFDDDLWLPAHQATTSVTGSPDGNITNVTTFSLDNDVNVLACTEQLQICNPNRRINEVECTPMLALNVLADWYINANNSGYLQNVVDNEEQLTTTSLLLYALNWAHLYQLLGDFNKSPLLLNNYQQQLASLGLADDQWLLEANHLFALTLNTIQRYITEFATGPPSPYSQYTSGWLAANPIFKPLCNSQIIRSPNFTSFSILGISLIFGLGGLTICVSLCMESVVGYFQRRWRRGLFQQLRWRLDGKLQLQRMAFEEAGLGIWQGGADQVPTTVVKGQKIVMPQSWDEEHPSLFLKGGKSGSAWSGSSATLLNELGEAGEEMKMLTKEKIGWRR
ncbi:hypothetical protein N431DRAFT_564404 [Stipitochalara longipes BDJ]|nr:hypothetical protein N431DRAFT_564404 [Stipitochalara longipes BDJ]